MPLCVSYCRLSQEPLGVPKINPDESSSSSGEESEPPVPLPRRSRRASSITRAGNAALSLSNNPNTAAANPPPTAASAGSSVVSSKPAEGAVRRVAVDDMDKSVRRLLVAAPSYPGGVGGRLVTDVSSSTAGMSSLWGGGGKRKGYRMVFDGKEASSRGGTPRELGQVAELPVGLEAVPDETDPTLLCVRELSSGGDGGAGGGGNSVGGSSTAGSLVARIKAKQTASGSRESFYSVMLEPGKGERAGAELMAVRISTHPTRLAAPREVEAVLLLPPRGEGAGEKLHVQDDSGWVAFDVSVPVFLQ